MEQHIRFCTSADGTRIGYATYENHPGPPLVFVHGWGHAMEPYWSNSWGRQYIEIPARRRRVVEYDRRGLGASQREVDDLSLTTQVDDLAAVVDAIDAEVIDLFGAFDGTAIAITYASRYPQRVSHLVLFSPFAAAEQAPMGQTAPQVAEMIRTDWSLARRALGTAISGTSVDLQRWFSRLLKDSMVPEVAARFWDDYMATLDVTEEVARVSAPTLVLHASHYQAIPREPSMAVAAAIPNAQFVSRPGDAEVFFEAFDEVVLPFLREDSEDEAPAPVAFTASSAAVILFTDIVDSTELTERLGDTRFREASRALDTALRGAIREAGGAAIDGKLLGDGVLATFPSAAQAIDGARRCLALSAASELGLHIGLHAGDVIREENNVFGGAVNIAARICALSEPGQILVSDVIRGMARSSAGVQFEDCGEQAMKGVSEPVRVWAVPRATQIDS